jgi:hypothetical protein
LCQGHARPDQGKRQPQRGYPVPIPSHMLIALDPLE